MIITFSIIMPVYNSEKFLAKAIDSVLAQSYTNFELILIDDGSKDGSPQICDEYEAKDSRVRVIHKENGGICKGRNLGISIAKGEYIGFMDNDDIVESDMLQECYNLIKEHNADWVKFGKREIMLFEEKEIGCKETDFSYKVYDSEALKKSLLKLRNQGAMTFVWDSFINREKLINSGLQFDERFPLGNEDIDFCEQLSLICETFVITDKIFYNHYTRFGISASTKYSEEKLQSYIYLLAKCNARYEEHNLTTSENESEYVNVVTRQIIVNICQRLNDAGGVLSMQEKCAKLKNCREQKEFLLYCRLAEKPIRNESTKLALYRKLFVNKKYKLLLLLDNYSRKIVYACRRYKAK